MQSQQLTAAALTKHAGLPLVCLAALLFIFIPSESQPFIECSIFPARGDQGLKWLTGHFCHSSLQHWIFNATGLGIFALLYGQRFNALHFTLLALGLILGTNLYLYLFYRLDFYLGLSSILYGLFLFSALAHFSTQRALSSLVVLALALQGSASYLSLYPDSKTNLPAAFDVHLASIGMGAFLYIVCLGWRVWRKRR